MSCRPDFTILIYPAYLANRDDPAGQLATEFHVTAQAPPAFIVQTEDDPVRVQNSLFYYLALVNVKVLAEMHLFSKGGATVTGCAPRALRWRRAPRGAEVWLRHRWEPSR